ncbi:MAG: rod shape-determining protein MreC [Gallionellaceae bacterium]|jgi:rod shape-determining protein MreC|nr:rod shape-determining protein MreC [Gallionellaceae bacterium]
MENTQPPRFFRRRSNPAARLIFFMALSFALLFVDARYQSLESLRSALSMLTYPVQRLASLPMEAWHAADDFFTSHEDLIRENAELRRQRTLGMQALQQSQPLKAENEHLRELLGMQQRVGYPTLLAEIAYVERDIFRRKLYLDKGAQAQVQAGEVVMDDTGVVGQITRVYPQMSEVTLITDKDHAVPVQVLRSGLRTVVFGSGDTTRLSLRYVPNEADIQEGDLLVTSGIDGTYPPGLPVATVEQVEHDPAYPFARIQCSSVAGVNRHRQLLILTGLPPRVADRPAPEPEAGDEQKSRRRRP